MAAELLRAWLKCDIAKGMFPGEYSIIASTANGQKISLFAPDSVVNTQRKLLAVGVIERAASYCLVYLPVTPIETSSRAIKVALTDIEV